jgi:alkylhydroperoxidase family enzyme
MPFQAFLPTNFLEYSMIDFPIHDESTAPEDSKPLLAKSKKDFGMIPGLHAVMAEAPGLLEGYQVLHKLFMNTSFDKDELTVIWQTINVEHSCHYCVPAHTGIAKSMKVDDAINDALRDETPLPNARLEALRTFTLSVVRERGNVDDNAIQAFIDAGFTKRQILEVVLGVSQKVMSNYTNHLAATPVDAAFKSFAWQKAA